MTKSKGINAPRERWSEDQLETLRLNYPNWPTYLVAHVCGHSVSSTYGKANELGLKKSAEFFDDEASGRMHAGDKRGASTRFQKGQAPANKGLRRPGYAPGRMADTQFKAGQRGNKYLPIGSERINSDGYLDRKVSDTGYPPKDWQPVHKLLWAEQNGPIPSGFAVVFKNGAKTDIRIENLELISRGELMRRNTIHRYPPELKQVIKLQGKLRRTIAKKA